MRVAVIVPASNSISEYSAVGLLFRIPAAALFGCLLFVSNSYAEAYYWISTTQPGQRFPDAVSACPKDIGTYFGSQLIFDRVDRAPESLSGSCIYIWSPDKNVYYGGIVDRRGDSCATGTGPYDPISGGCPIAPETGKNPGDECNDQTGGTASNPMIWDSTSNKCEKFLDAKGDAPCAYIAGLNPNGTTSYKVAGNLDAGGNAVAPPSFTDESLSCAVQTISSSECTLSVSGAISCNVEGRLTGKANSQGDQNAADAFCRNGRCPVKEPETKTNESGCSPTSDGSGGSTCTQTKETVQEGTQQCGQVNGVFKCITRKPYSNGIITNIKSTSQTLSDGSVQVTTVKDASNTVCTDVKTCTTKTSSTTVKTITKPNGTTTTETSCKGSCNNNGGGLETDPNSGSGNAGNGTGGGGVGGNGEGGGGGIVATSDSCAVAPSCDGDPFQCAILQQAHIDTCKLMAPPTAEQQAAADAKVDAAYAALDAHQIQLDKQVNTLLSQFQSSTPGTGIGGKCLPDFKFSVMGISQSMEFSKVCDSISWVRLIVLAGAYLFAARIVFREV